MRRLVKFVTVGLALMASCSFAQEPTEPTETLFGDFMEVRLVNVEVHASDKQGRAVTDLTRDDFELFEDGRPVKITNFRAFRGSGVSTSPPTLPVTESGKDGDLAPTETKATADPLHLVVYVDNLHLRQFSRNRVLRQMRTFLREDVPRSTRVMLVTFERSLHVRQGFTTDLQLITDASFELEELTAFSVQRQTERATVIKRITSSRDNHEAESHASTYANSAFHDVETSISGMRQVIDLVAGLPGRKAILYTAEGLPLKAGEDLFDLVRLEYRDGQGTGLGLRAQRYSANRLFRQLAAYANSQGVTFYTLEATGANTHSSLSAEHSSPSSMIEVDVTDRLNRQQPLLMLAEDTGGISTINTSNFRGAFDRLAQDLTTYYSLGYAPAHTGEGRFHRFEVKVKRPGVRLRYRDGYRDKSNTSMLADGVLAALRHSSGGNPLEISLDLPGTRVSKDGLVAVEVRLPLGNLTLAPQGSMLRGGALVALAVVDDEGGTSPVQQERIPFEIPQKDWPTAQNQYFVYAVEMRLGKGRQLIGVGVRDEISGELSFVTRAVSLSP